jgi:hypothetical protein
MLMVRGRVGGSDDVGEERWIGWWGFGRQQRLGWQCGGVERDGGVSVVSGCG